MSYTPYTSVNALAHAIMKELDRDGNGLLHGHVHISHTISFLRNGVKQCSVQVECEAGCGWLVQANGEEADVLEQKVIAIKRHLQREGEETSKSAVEILSTFIPGFLNEVGPTMPKRAKELIV